MGSNEFLLLLVSNYEFYLVSLCISFVLIFILNKFFHVRFFGGLFPCTVNLMINFATIIFFVVLGKIGGDKFLQFIFAELALYCTVIVLYRRFCPQLIACINKISTRSLHVISLFVLLILSLSIVYNFLIIDAEATSRVEYQLTSSSFSYIKPILYFVSSLAMFLPFIQYQRKMSNFLIFSTLTFIFVNTLSAQSKGSFIVGLLGAYLLLKEYKYFNVVSRSIKSNKFTQRIYIALVGVLFLVNLYALNISPIEIFARVAYASDSVFMTYPNENIDQLCYGTDNLTAYHRGLARIFHITASEDPTTIFGVRLVQNVEGEDSLRGPNARVSSYSLCNFGLIGFLPFVIYIALLLFMQYKLLTSIVKRFQVIALYFGPYFLTVILFAPQDVYLAMSNFTVICLLWLFFKLISIGVISPKRKILMSKNKII